MINPEKQLQENALKANFTEFQQQHFDRLMSELERISGGLGFAELKAKAEAGDKETLQVMRNYIAKKERIVEFIETKKIPFANKELVDPGLIESFVDDLEALSVKLDKWNSYAEMNGKLYGRICIDDVWLPIIKGEIIRELVDADGNKYSVKSVYDMSFQNGKILAHFNLESGKTIAVIDDSGRILEQVGACGDNKFEVADPVYAHPEDIHFDQTTGSFGFSMNDKYIDPKTQEWRAKRIPVYVENGKMTEVDQVDGHPLNYIKELEFINGELNGYITTKGFTEQRKHTPVIDGKDIVEFKGNEIIDCRYVKNIDNKLCARLSIVSKGVVVVNRGEEVQLDDLPDDNPVSHDVDYIEYTENSINGRAKVSYKRPGQMAGYVLEYPIVEGRVIREIDGHKIKQTESVEVIEGKLNCSARFEVLPGDYYPVINGEIITEIEGRKIKNCRNVHNVGGKVCGRFFFEGDVEGDVVMGKIINYYD